jgi:hypothetical protein
MKLKSPSIRRSVPPVPIPNVGIRPSSGRSISTFLATFFVSILVAASGSSVTTVSIRFRDSSFTGIPERRKSFKLNRDQLSLVLPLDHENQAFFIHLIFYFTT